MSAEHSLHLAVALDGAGWHPGAWRTTPALSSGLFDPDYWTDLAREAERGLLDLVTFEDRFAPNRPVATSRISASSSQLSQRRRATSTWSATWANEAPGSSTDGGVRRPTLSYSRGSQLSRTRTPARPSLT